MPQRPKRPHCPIHCTFIVRNCFGVPQTHIATTVSHRFAGLDREKHPAFSEYNHASDLPFPRYAGVPLRNLRVAPSCDQNRCQLRKSLATIKRPGTSFTTLRKSLEILVLTKFWGRVLGVP